MCVMKEGLVGYGACLSDRMAVGGGRGDACYQVLNGYYRLSYTLNLRIRNVFSGYALLHPVELLGKKKSKEGQGKSAQTQNTE